MVYPKSRSMNASLSEGMTDGKYKKVVQDRDGVVEHTFWKERGDLDDNWYGIHEKDIKAAPDALQHPTPNFISTPTPDGDVY